MAVYTHLSETDLHTLGARYDLDVQSSEAIPYGSTNSNFLLRTDQGPFILTLIEDSPLERALELAQLLRMLNNHGFQTANPLASTSGDLVVTFGGKPVMVKPYLEGTVAFDPSDTVLREVGAAMARLHEIPSPSFLSGRPLSEIWKATPSISLALDASSGTDLTGHLRAFEEVDLRALPHGLIHGDICYDNILVHDGALTAVIDFEEAFYGPRVFDIGMTLVGLCRTSEGIDLAKSRAVIEGYESLRPLEADERAMLPRTAAYAAHLNACWRFWKFHIDAPDPEKRTHHMELVRVAAGILRQGPIV